MSILGTIVLPAVLPAAIDGVKQLITKFTGGVQPQSIDDVIKIQQADVAKLESLAKLDNPYGTPSQWVIDLRASFRYIAAGLVICVALGTLFFPLSDAIRMVALDWGSAAGFFIFGERTLMRYKT